MNWDSTVHSTPVKKMAFVINCCILESIDKQNCKPLYKSDLLKHSVSEPSILK